MVTRGSRILYLCAVALAVAILWLAVSASAQTPPAASSPTPVPAPQQAPATPAPAHPANDRIFGVLPNYTTVENANTLPPLSVHDKFALASDGTFDPVEFALVGVLAGFNQVGHENPTWGYGAGGYAKRYGEAFANQAIESTMAVGVFPSLLHQDPRYYQKGKGGFIPRFVYAASRIVMTTGDAHQREFNFSEVGGSLAAAGLSNLYEPRGSRTIGNTTEVWGTQVAVDAMTNELCEFWPDIKRHLFHK